MLGSLLLYLGFALISKVSDTANVWQRSRVLIVADLGSSIIDAEKLQTSFSGTDQTNLPTEYVILQRARDGGFESHGSFKSLTKGQDRKYISVTKENVLPWLLEKKPNFVICVADNAEVPQILTSAQNRGLLPLETILKIWMVEDNGKAADKMNLISLTTPRLTDLDSGKNDGNRLESREISSSSERNLGNIIVEAFQEGYNRVHNRKRRTLKLNFGSVVSSTSSNSTPAVSATLSSSTPAISVVPSSSSPGVSGAPSSVSHVDIPASSWSNPAVSTLPSGSSPAVTPVSSSSSPAVSVVSSSSGLVVMVPSSPSLAVTPVHSTSSLVLSAASSRSSPAPTSVSSSSGHVASAASSSSSQAAASAYSSSSPEVSAASSRSSSSLTLAPSSSGLVISEVPSSPSPTISAAPSISSVLVIPASSGSSSVVFPAPSSSSPLASAVSSSSRSITLPVPLSSSIVVSKASSSPPVIPAPSSSNPEVGAASSSSSPAVVAASTSSSPTVVAVSSSPSPTVRVASSSSRFTALLAPSSSSHAFSAAPSRFTPASSSLSRFTTQVPSSSSPGITVVPSSTRHTLTTALLKTSLVGSAAFSRTSSFVSEALSSISPVVSAAPSSAHPIVTIELSSAILVVSAALSSPSPFVGGAPSISASGIPSASFTLSTAVSVTTSSSRVKVTPTSSRSMRTVSPSISAAISSTGSVNTVTSSFVGSTTSNTVASESIVLSVISPTTTAGQPTPSSSHVVTEQPLVYKNETVIIVFDGDCNYLKSNSQRESAFREAVEEKVSSKLSILRSEIVVGEVECGSIRVPITFYQSSGSRNVTQVLKKIVDSGNLSVTVGDKTFKASKLEVIRPASPATQAPTTEAKVNKIALYLYIGFGILMAFVFCVGICVFVVRCRKDRREGSFFLTNDTNYELRRFHGIPRASTYSRVNYYGEPVEMDATTADPNAEDEFKVGAGAYSYNRSPARGRGKLTGTTNGDAHQEDKFSVGALGMPEWNLPRLSEKEVTVAESKEVIPRSAGSVGSRQLLIESQKSSLADSAQAHDNPVLTFGDGQPGLGKEEN